MRVILVYGGGGHTIQMMKLAELLDPKHTYIPVMSKGDVFTRRFVKDCREIRVPRIEGEGKLKTVFRTAISFGEALAVVRAEEPDAIIWIWG